MHTYMYNQQRERVFVQLFFYFMIYFWVGFLQFEPFRLCLLFYSLLDSHPLSPLFEATISVLTPQESGFIEMQ